MRSERFGRLLKAAIGSIVAHEGTTAPVIEAELGQQIGLSVPSIQRYKAGHIPPDPRTIELLATAAVQRGFLNRAWLSAFLQAAGYSAGAPLIARLCPADTAAPPGMPARIYNNLPAPTYTHFVPRPAAYADVLDGLSQRSAAVLIAGIGGMGKTSLAREVASACIAGAPDLPPFAAVVWVSDQDHPGSTTLATLLHEIVLTLDYPGLLQLDYDARRREVENLLRRQAVLLVVDNCETITDTALFSWLLRIPEPSKVLLTSRAYRQELQRGCWLVELPGLSAAEAQAVLAHKLRALKLEQRIGSGDQLGQLLEATGGNPKALEIVLGYLKYGTQTAAQVADDLRAARGEIFDDLFARCWALLGQQARRVLLAMSLFQGTAGRDALAATAGVQGSDYAQALEQLLALALVDGQPGDLSAPRYALHPLVRAFAGARLHEQPQLEQQARERQLAWYADLAAGVGYCWDDLARLNLLDPEQETITALIRWYAGQGHFAALLRLLRGVDYYYFIRGLSVGQPGISELRALAEQHAGNDEDATLALAYHIQMLCRQGQPAEAGRQLAQLEALSSRAALSDTARFEVQYTHALYWMACQDDARASQIWRAALPLARRVSVRAYAVNRGWLAICRYRQGALAEAQALWSEVLRDAQAGGFARGVVSSQIGLARICLDQGQADAAFALLAVAESSAQRYHDRATVAEINTLYARYHLLRGDQAAAQACLAAAQDTFARLGTAQEPART